MGLTNFELSALFISTKELEGVLVGYLSGTCRVLVGYLPCACSVLVRYLFGTCSVAYYPVTRINTPKSLLTTKFSTKK